MLRDTLGSDAQFLPVPEDSPLYHCYFDFDDGAPSGAESLLRKEEISKDVDERKLGKDALYLEGIWLDNRLVALYSDKGYLYRWNNPEFSEPQIKLGVNIVVFAVTKWSSEITKKELK